MAYNKNRIRTYKEDQIDSYEDLMCRFVRDWHKNNPKPMEFVLMSDKPEILKAYNLMITRSYEDKEPT